MIKIALFTAALLLPLGLSAQETVILRDGTQFTGRLVGFTGTAISFQDRDGGTRRFDRDQIDSIRFSERGREEGNNSYRQPPTGNNDPVPGNGGGDDRGYASRSAYRGGDDQYRSYVTLPQGTEIAVRTNETISSQDSRGGRSYSAQVDRDVIDQNGNVVVPRGSEAQLLVRRMGDNDLALDLQSISVNGQRFNVNTADVTERGNGHAGIGENKRTAEYVGGTALVGTLLGAIAGGGKGAAIGALAGGAVGAGAEVATRGSQIRVPAETVVSFRLDNPVVLNPVQ